MIQGKSGCFQVGSGSHNKWYIAFGGVYLVGATANCRLLFCEERTRIKAYDIPPTQNVLRLILIFLGYCYSTTPNRSPGWSSGSSRTLLL